MTLSRSSRAMRAYEVKPGDALYSPPEKRVRLW
jgi:predicted metalloendopeptidase